MSQPQQAPGLHKGFCVLRLVGQLLRDTRLFPLPHSHFPLPSPPTSAVSLETTQRSFPNSNLLSLITSSSPQQLLPDSGVARQRHPLFSNQQSSVASFGQPLNPFSLWTLALHKRFPFPSECCS